MFKRANKITALVVAAASIMSVVPAMAADAQRLGTKKGSIKEAYAYDGKYIYEGYKGDDADRAVYANESGTEKQVDSLNNVGFSSSGAVVNKFGDKFISVVDGNDNYAVDLSNMKVYDDDDTKLASSIADSAARKVQNKLKNTDKYGENYNFGGEENLDLTGTYTDTFKTLFKNQFGDTWYQFTTQDAVTSTPQAVVFNTTGQYVDITKDLNMKLYDVDNKLVTVEEFDKDYGTTGKKITASLVANSQLVIAQDKDNFYALAKIQLTGAYNVKTHTAITAPLTIVQKISKAQGEKDGKAYLPKTTVSYMYDEADVYDIDDAQDAGKALADVRDTVIGTPRTSTSGSKNYVYKAEARAIDGVLYVTTGKYEVISATQDKLVHVDTNEVKLNSHGKVKDPADDHVKYDLYTAVKGENDDKDAAGYSIDTDGTLWIVNDGEIKKSVKAKDFETIYDVDSSIDKLDVYNEGNLIAWSNGTDRYTTITEGKKQTTDDAVVVDPNVNADKFKTGFDATTKKYYKDGALVTNAWVSDAGKWYFVDENSTAKTGWYKNAQGTYYYLQADGAMLTGWFKDPADGNWYYLDPVNTSGAMKTGWFQDTTGTWYFAEGSGKMLSNTYVGQYWLNGSGAWVQ